MEHTIDSVIDIIEKASSQGVSMFLEDGKLKIKVAKNTKPAPELVQQIKEQKSAIIDFLSSEAGNFKEIIAEEPQINPIDRSHVQHIPLSFSQERLWFIDQLEGSTAYHIPAVLELKGELNVPILADALRQIVNRHEVLRSVIKTTTDGQAYQEVKERDLWELEFQVAQEGIDLDHYIQKYIDKAFQLDSEHMLRGVLIQQSAERSILILVMHHIAADGWSTTILVNELMEIYQSLLTNQPIALVDLPIQYVDYAVWQRNHLSGDLLEQKMNYWEKQLQGVEPLELPIDFPRPAIQSSRGNTLHQLINPTLSQQLQELSQAEGTTLYMTLLAAFKVFLYRYTGQVDICVGSPIANRAQKELEPLVGFFVNTLALRSNLANNPSFKTLLAQVKANTLDAYSHQEVPFEKIVDQLAISRDPSRSPLFQVMFILQNNSERAELKFGGVEVNPLAAEQNTAKLDLAFNLKETENGLSLGVEYCTDLFEEQTVLRMMEHFQMLLSSIVQNSAQSINQLSLLTAKAQQQLVTEFNNTVTDFPKDQTIISLFERQVVEQPQAIALAFKDQKLTYTSLNEKANQVANFLKSKGLAEEDLVGLCLGRSMEMIIGLLGILKAGAAYVPIDTDYPQDRINYMLSDANINLVLTDSCCQHLLSNLAETRRLVLDKDWGIIKQQAKSNLPTKPLAHNLAYVIYTSGSTGKPKGVLLEHKGVVNMVCSHQKVLNIQAEEGVLQFASIGFDGASFEIYNTLLNGGKLVLAEKERLTNPEALQSLIHQHQIKLAGIPPSYQETVKDHLEGLQLLVSGGEALKAAVLASLPKNLKVLNSYGPTENTCCVTLAEQPLLANGEVTIGKPIANVQAYVLGVGQQLVPVGVAGELCVGGAQVARGYLFRPELDTERFIDDPFSKEVGAKLYRTGDLVKWLPDGNLKYLGRIDGQVKVRGHRIELGEIEQVLQEVPQISQCAVVLIDNAGQKRLVAYVIATKDFDKEDAQAYLKSKLPPYMVPAQFVTLESFPLTPNGKIDKKALSDTETAGLLVDQYVAPRNEIEQHLANIWSDLLKVEQIGIHDNFFELGGDSIITIQVVSRAKQFGYQLQAKDLFQHQTIAALAKVANNQARIIETEEGLLTGEAPLSPIQHWFFDKDFEGRSHFNQALLLQLDKYIGAEAIAQFVELLMAQHDALRFTYQKESDTWIQAYGSTQKTLECIDIQDVDSAVLANSITEICQEYQQKLSIEDGELVKFVWIKTPQSESKNRLFIAIHHLAIDGVSWRILLEQLTSYLAALNQQEIPNLGKKGTSYRQWVQALSQYAVNERITDQKAYWLSLFEDWKSLPTDFPMASSTMADVKKFSVCLDESLTTALLHQTNKAYQTEINDVLLAALGKTISDYSQHHQVLIGLEGHGREDISKEIDISQTVGWFTNLYPVALSINSEYAQAELIKSVKEQLRAIPQKGIGYGLLRYLHPNQELRNEFANQQWEILFNYLGQFDNALNENQGLQIAPESIGESLSPDYPFTSKLEINSSISDGQLRLAWTYSSKQYQNNTIEQIAQQYIENLTALITHCEAQEESQSTPSDYGLGAEVSFAELDDFLKNEMARNGQLISLYPLSPLQEGMLFHALYEQSSTAYIEQFVFDFPEGLHVEAFRNAWQGIVKHHSIMRTAFFHDELSIPIQAVYPEAEIPLEVMDYTALASAEQERKISEFAKTDRQKGFDYSQPPLMRITLIKCSNQVYKMVWTSHHLVMDGWSLPLLMNELLTSYERLIVGQSLAIRAVDEYGDFINYLQAKDGYETKAFWKKYMEGLEEPSLLPFVGHIKDRNKGAGEIGELKLEFDEVTTLKIRTYAQDHHFTVNTLIQGIWAYLLATYTGNRQVTFGVTVSGRPSELAQAESRIGLYINTLPLCALVDDQPIATWLTDLQEGQTQAREYQHAGLNEIQQLIGIKGDLFDSLLVFENYPVGEVLTKDWSLKISNVQIQEQTNYLLTLVAGLGNTLSLKFSYNASLLHQDDVGLMSSHFKRAMHQIIHGLVNQITEIDLLSDQEKQRLLSIGNRSKIDWPKEENIASLFEKQVVNTPQHIALCLNEREVTYQELNQKANQLAHYLKQQGVQSNELVGICLNRSVELVIGVLAILKAGAAYVPIDPDYPTDRIDYTLQDAKVSYVLTLSANKQLFDEVKGVTRLVLDELEELLQGESNQNLNIPILPSNLAYVIYTSGTTGKPKGVLLQHQQVVRLFFTASPLFDFGNQDVWTLFHSFCFDFSVWEMFGALLHGGRLVIVPKQVAKDTAAFMSLLDKEKVTVLNQTPSAFYTLQEQLNAARLNLPIRYVIFGGEQLNPAQLMPWKKQFPKCKLINMYGITETTVHVTYKEVLAEDMETSTSNIGVPLPTLSCYVLDNNRRLAPQGVVGELYVGGAGVAAGYLNRPVLTSERFVNDPFEEGDSKLYRTGDLARWLPNGELVYLGRADDQVKIRGYRIELGEVESALNEAPNVVQSIVLAKESAFSGDAQQYLVAWVVVENNFDKERILSHISAKLPDYMIPSFIVELNQVPLTSNGKIDKKQLPNPKLSIVSNDNDLAPRNSIEITLANQWKKLLGLKSISIHANFFELGGHSLLATRAIAAIRKEFGVDLAIKNLFEQPTIAQLAIIISQETAVSVIPSMQKQERPAKIPLSYAQERLWLIHQLEGSTHYHIPSVLKLKGKLDRDCLAFAFRQIIQRHEVLRTVIREDQGEPYQEIQGAMDWTLDYSDDGRMLNQEEITAKVHQPFNLSEEVMLRAFLSRINEDEHVLILVLHHIASDGWSIGILIRELAELYEAKKAGKETNLEALPIQYADYALWQQKLLTSEVIDDKLAYWKDKLVGTGVLELPNDKEQLNSASQAGTIAFTLDSMVSDQVNAKAKSEGTTLFMYLLAAFKVLLYRYSGQEDICVGSPIANRTQKEVEPLIGFFLNTLALRTELDGNWSFLDLLAQVKATTLDAYTHQDVPFEKVLEVVKPERHANRTPLFQVFFNLQNQPQELIETGDLIIEQLSSSVASSKFDITLYVSENEEGIKGLFVYNAQLFSPQRMEQMAIDFKELIQEVLKDSKCPIKYINFLSETEQQEQEQELMDFFGDF